MKFLIVLALGALVGCVIANEEYDPHVIQTFLECSEEFGITKEILLSGIKEEVGADNLKCFFRCMQKNLGLIVGGRLNVEKLKQMMMAVGDKDITQVQAEIDMCNNIIKGADTCDEAWDLAKCLDAQIKE